MNLEEFHKIKKCVDLFNFDGSDTNSDYVKEELIEIVEKQSARGESLDTIKNLLNRKLSRLEPYSKSHTKHANKNLKKLGFKVK